MVDAGRRLVPATFASRPIVPDPEHEIGLANHLRNTLSVEERTGLYGRFCHGQTRFDADMRRIVLRSLVKEMGYGVTVAPGFLFLHPQTFHIGEGGFFGAGAYLQGRHDGSCYIGRRCWIGPGAFVDARDFVLEDFAGLGPGAKVIGSQHTGDPVDVPILSTDLLIRSVRIGKGTDVGSGAVILPGVTIGEGVIVGAPTRWWREMSTRSRSSPASQPGP